jgi:hypothetical protein
MSLTGAAGNAEPMLHRHMRFALGHYLRTYVFLTFLRKEKST